MEWRTVVVRCLFCIFKVFWTVYIQLSFIKVSLLYVQRWCFQRGQDPWKACEWWSHKSKLWNEEDCLWGEATLVPLCSGRNTSRQRDNLQLRQLLLLVASQGRFILLKKPFFWFLYIPLTPSEHTRTVLCSHSEETDIYKCKIALHLEKSRTNSVWRRCSQSG